MIFSIIKPLVKYSMMLIVVVFGAMICGLIATIPIRLNPAMPSLLRTLGFWISVLCFGVVMLDSVKRRRISEEELKTIMALHKQHFSSGQITKELLSKFGIFRRSGTIRSAIKRNSKKKVENLD